MKKMNNIIPEKWLMLIKKTSKDYLNRKWINRILSIALFFISLILFRFSLLVFLYDRSYSDYTNIERIRTHLFIKVYSADEA